MRKQGALIWRLGCRKGSSVRERPGGIESTAIRATAAAQVLAIMCWLLAAAKADFAIMCLQAFCNSDRDGRREGGICNYVLWNLLAATL